MKRMNGGRTAKSSENSRTRMNIKFEVDGSRPDTDVHIPNFSYLGMMILEFELRQPGIETTAIVDLNGGNRWFELRSSDCHEPWIRMDAIFGLEWWRTSDLNTGCDPRIQIAAKLGFKCWWQSACIWNIADISFERRQTCGDDPLGLGDNPDLNTEWGIVVF